MITKEFTEACVEFNEILNYLPNEYVEKIPMRLRKFLKEVESKDYITNINPHKPLDAEKMLPKTKTLLTIIYRDYWCDEEERKMIDKILIENDKKYEEELKEKYNQNNIFKNRITKVENNNTSEEKYLIEHKASIFRKTINKIRHIFKR